MCNNNQNLTQKQWREVYFDSRLRALFLDTQDGVWKLEPVTRQDIEEHIFKHGSEGIDYQYGHVHEWDKYEGRSFLQTVKVVIVDIEDWLDHYVVTHHSELLEIPE